MRLHLLGLPHTITRDQFSHCAFTGKVQKMSPMMRPLGYEVWHYGVGGAESGANVQIDVMTEEEQVKLLGHRHGDPSRFVGDDARVDNAVYKEFNSRLRELLKQHVLPGELILLPFGHAHQYAVHDTAGIPVESGIGYPISFSKWRIFESYAWMHYHQGKFGREGNAYEWVIPNYFVESEWPAVPVPDDYVLCFGRIDEIKGLWAVVDAAARLPNQLFVICGQGDPTKYLRQPNIHYIPPVHGKARAALMGRAKALLAPSQFTEPFCGVAVEAMLCGTPAIVPTYGAPVETVEHGKTGWHCRTLPDYVRAIELADQLDRDYIAARARAKWSLEAVGPQYDKAFRQLADLHSPGGGWYTWNGGVDDIRG